MKKYVLMELKKLEQNLVKRNISTSEYEGFQN
jgi:hypothetical protein